MTWHTRYKYGTEFLTHFDNEQDFIDAMFIHMIMWNFGVYMDHTMLYRDT